MGQNCCKQEQVSDARDKLVRTHNEKKRISNLTTAASANSPKSYSERRDCCCQQNELTRSGTCHCNKTMAQSLSDHESDFRGSYATFSGSKN